MTCIQELYESANASMELFKGLLAKAVAGTSAVVSVAPLKAQARVLEKARDDYLERVPGPPVSYVYDIVRGAILCPDEDTILHVVHFLLHGGPPPSSSASTVQREARVLRLKNRFQNPTPGERPEG